jgi:hypothetical protein
MATKQAATASRTTSVTMERGRRAFGRLSRSKGEQDGG